MDAGRMNRRITIQAKSISYDALNEPIPSWQDKCTVWAEAIESNGREFYAAQKLNSETSIVFRVRYTKKINSQMRIVFGSRILEILGTPHDPDGRRRELLISAKGVE